MKAILLVSAIAVSFAALPAFSEVQPSDPAAAVKSAIAADASQLINIVTKEVSATPDKAADIVKSAIEAAKPSPEMVGEIVKAAIIAAPKQTEAIITAALAMAPDAVEQIALAVATANMSADEVAALTKSRTNVVIPGAADEVAALTEQQKRNIQSFSNSLMSVLRNPAVSVDVKQQFIATWSTTLGNFTSSNPSGDGFDFGSAPEIASYLNTLILPPPPES